MTTLVVNLPDGNLVGARVRNYRAVVELAAQAVGSHALFRVPPGMRFLRGYVTTDTSLATSTIAVGIEGATGKYKAAGTLTDVDTPTAFGEVAAMLADTTSEVGSSPLGAGTNEDVILTVAVAALPASGNLVIDMEFAGV